jgi:hypothetical protein
MPPTRHIELPSRYPRDAEGWTLIYSDIQKALLRSVKKVDGETKNSGMVNNRDSVYVGRCGRSISLVLPMRHSQLLYDPSVTIATFASVNLGRLIILAQV